MADMRDRLIELLDKVQSNGNATKAGINYIQNSTLADYLIENGVILPPCKVGDTVYVIGSKYRCGREEKWINTGKFRLGDIDRIGKTVFLTKEEAQKALEERSKQ